jgi:hypothetical protein
MRAASLSSIASLGLVGLVGASLVVACSGTSTKGSGFGGSTDGGGSLLGDDGGGSGGSSGSGSGSSSGGFGSTSSSGGGGNGCSGQATNFVYVLSAENDLYSFAPNLKKFTKIGSLNCNASMQPNSMAVDRNAVAYVDYVQTDPLTGMDSAGAIYKVSTQNASCMGKAMDMPSGWYRVGMGYSTTSNGGTSELLYVAGVGNGVTGGTGLGLADFGKMTVGSIGPFTGSLAGQNAELTGTGAGTLFGFFTTNPVQVAEINPMSGMIKSQVPMTGVKMPNDWAFSFWGGHFYLYTSQGQGIGNGSDVTDYDPSTGNINTTFMTGIGFDIVGAGVSTCAPVAPVQ